MTKMINHKNNRKGKKKRKKKWYTGKKIDRIDILRE